MVISFCFLPYCCWPERFFCSRRVCRGQDATIRVEELIDDGVRGARGVKLVQDRLDEYLSVCQLGITFASIGLGFVAEPAIVRILEPIIAWTGWFNGHREANG